jgi:large subunit ribosomal protein L18
MSVKKLARLRRAKKTRKKINQLRVKRLCVHRTPRHIYAQIISELGDHVIASASTLEKENRKDKTEIQRQLVL